MPFHEKLLGALAHLLSGHLEHGTLVETRSELPVHQERVGAEQRGQPVTLDEGLPAAAGEIAPAACLSPDP